MHAAMQNWLIAFLRRLVPGLFVVLLTGLFASLAAAALPPVGTAPGAGSSSPARQPTATLDDVAVYLDGEKLNVKQLYKVKRADTYTLRVENLQPYSEVKIKVKLLGFIGVKQYTHEVGESGSAEQLLDTPDKKVRVKCVVTYINNDGIPHTKKFRLKIR
jgi:hypothetical protein